METVRKNKAGRRKTIRAKVSEAHGKSAKWALRAAQELVMCHNVPVAQLETIARVILYHYEKENAK